MALIALIFNVWANFADNGEEEKKRRRRTANTLDRERRRKNDISDEERRRRKDEEDEKMRKKEGEREDLKRESYDPETPVYTLLMTSPFYFTLHYELSRDSIDIINLLSSIYS